VESIKRHICVLKVGFHCVVSTMCLVNTLVVFLVLRNSNICLAMPFSCFCNWIRLVADVVTIGGSLPDFPDAAQSPGMDSVPVESVSMFAMKSVFPFKTLQ
jgi:hypothetical protein